MTELSGKAFAQVFVIPSRADGEGPHHCSVGLLAPYNPEAKSDWHFAEAYDQESCEIPRRLRGSG